MSRRVVEGKCLERNTGAITVDRDAFPTVEDPKSPASYPKSIQLAV